jgi:hypothetical protein
VAEDPTAEAVTREALVALPSPKPGQVHGPEFMEDLTRL